MVSQITDEVTGGLKSDIFLNNRMEQLLKFTYVPTNVIAEKKIGMGGFSLTLHNFQSNGSWQMLMSAYKVGGWGKKRPKMRLGIAGYALR